MLTAGADSLSRRGAAHRRRRGFRYKLRSVCAQFPIKGSVSDDGQAVMVHNFLSAKRMLCVEVLSSVTCYCWKRVKEDLVAAAAVGGGQPSGCLAGSGYRRRRDWEGGSVVAVDNRHHRLRGDPGGNDGRRGVGGREAPTLTPLTLDTCVSSSLYE